MGWELFLPDSYFNRVETRVHELARSVAECRVKSGGLMGGSAGVSCFFAHYAEYSKSVEYQVLAGQMLEQAINPQNGTFGGYSFAEGMAGIGWTLRHLTDQGLMNYDASEIFTHIDSRLYTWMMGEMKEGHYDYLHGALGIALYFLRDTENPTYRSYLKDVVLELEKHAISSPDGSIKWTSTLDAKTGLEGVNLSLSHGLASIIIILTVIMEAGIEEPVCSRLITGALQYLDDQKLDPEKYISSFPSWAKESTEEPGNSRLAWCYGDLGIGLAYVKAAQYIPLNALHLDGLEILLRASERRDLTENKVHDAGICHGASGLALIFNVLYQQTARKTFREAALYWLDVTLNMATHEEGLAGYKAWYHPQHGGWQPVPGLLEGAAGIGLVLLSFISGREATWSKCLLVDQDL